MGDAANFVNFRTEEHKTPTVLRPPGAPLAKNTTAPWDPMIPRGPSGLHATSFPAGIVTPSGSLAGIPRSPGQDTTSHRRAKSRGKEGAEIGAPSAKEEEPIAIATGIAMKRVPSA